MKRFWHRIKCALGMHELYKIGEPNEWTTHAGCTHCTRQWGINWNVQGGVPIEWFRVEHLYRGKYQP